jgi:hypothetical protein
MTSSAGVRSIDVKESSLLDRDLRTGRALPVGAYVPVADNLEVR